jgi:fucose 4-O-acetylase-like acetyltransferase
MNITKRIDIIDALKGIAILLVVLGHAVQRNVTDFDSNVAFRLIYSFHMPFFMFLSGLVASYSFDTPVKTYLRKKFMALVVPFASWYGLAYFVNGAYHTVSLTNYIGRVFLSPDWGLWFLWVLFLNFCFLVIAVKMEKGLGISGFLVVIMLVSWIPSDYFGLGLTKIHLVYFIMGYLIMRCKDSLKRYFTLAQLLSLIIFPVLVSQWSRTKGFSFSKQVFDFFGSLSAVFAPQLIMYGSTVLMALSGIAVSYILVNYVIEKTVVYKYLCKLGNYTLDIYVSHQYFLYGVGLGATRIFSSAFVAVILSLGLSLLILRRVQVLNLLFLGGRFMKIKNKTLDLTSI